MTCCAGWRRASSMRARRSGWQACCRGSTIPRVSPQAGDWIIECASADELIARVGDRNAGPLVIPASLGQVCWGRASKHQDRRCGRSCCRCRLGDRRHGGIERLHESDDLEVFFTERALAEREKSRAEGRAEGIAQGMDQGIEQGIVRGLRRRSGPAAPAFRTRKCNNGHGSERLAGLLSRIDDPERLAEAGDWTIVMCHWRRPDRTSQRNCGARFVTPRCRRIA